MKEKCENKIKVRIKGDQLISKVKISSDYVVNINQCDLLEQKCSYGFLKLISSKKNRFEFIGPKGVSLHERLKKKISEYDFFFIMEQIVDVVEKLEKTGLSRNNLILDLKYVFFNESINELSFIYLPIATPHSGKSMLAFVEEIIYATNPIETDSKYLSKFSYLIKKMDEFDANRIESYIYENNSDIVNIIKREPVRGKRNVNVLEINLGREFSCVMPNNEIEENLNDDEKTDIMSEEFEETDLLSRKDLMQDPKGRRQKVAVLDAERTYLLDDEMTVILQEDEDKTELFEETQAVSQRYPTLIRRLTEEIIPIDKAVFRIGKEENSVDYIVTNNIAISRSHADIISRGGRYFVFDLRSKNKSYINNRVLPAEHEVEIFNGDVLKLANEEFVFQV